MLSPTHEPLLCCGELIVVVVAGDLGQGIELVVSPGIPPGTQTIRAGWTCKRTADTATAKRSPPRRGPGTVAVAGIRQDR